MHLYSLMVGGVETCRYIVEFIMLDVFLYTMLLKGIEMTYYLITN
jgi:hypothetical protein